MQIGSNHFLPVLSGPRPQTTSRQAATPQRPLETVETPAGLVSYTDSEQSSRRPPLYAQPAQAGKLSHTGEAALRTYRDVALAGNQAELVNRVNVIA